MRKRTIAISVIALVMAAILCACGSQMSAESEKEPPKELEVTFIDVGQGDAALLSCGGHNMLIDGGPASQSSKIYAILKQKEIEKLDCVVATHPDEDHIGGISGAAKAAEIEAAYCSVTESNVQNFEDMLKYLSLREAELKVPTAGDTFPLGGAIVKVIGPEREYEDDNNGSIVLKVIYGETAFLFAGDAELAAEDDMIASGQDLSATVLKVSHHGSLGSSGEAFLRAVSPKYAVVSVGKDNSYGHPASETLQRLSDCGAKVYRTDMQGTVTCISDGKVITFTASRNEDAKTVPDKTEPAEEVSRTMPILGGNGTEESAETTVAAEDTVYIGNKKSRKFHKEECSSLPAEKNRVMFTTREDALEAGYTPCGNCKP